MRAEQALLEWIPVNSRLCAVQLNGSVRTQRNRDTRRCLFVVSAYAPTDCSPDKLKDEFYRNLCELLQKAKHSDIVVVAGDFNAQIGSLDQTERHLGGYFSVPAQRTDNGDHLLQLCSDNRLFLANTNFRHKERHRLTWRPPSPRQRWTQIDHIAISHRWRGSIEDCRSFWSTCLDSDHALVRARICLHLTGRRKATLEKPIRTDLSDEKVKSKFQEQLGSQLGNSGNQADPDVAWNDLKTAVETAASSTSNLNRRSTKNQWISATSMALMSSRQLIPSGSEHDEERKQIKSKLSRSLRNDREQWWATKAKEMEKAAALGNTRQLYRLIRETGIKKSRISETISEKDDTVICSQPRRLERWAEHFKEQFSWPSATLQLPSFSTQAKWNIEVGPPTLAEVQKAISNLKRRRAAGPDGLTPEVFKDGSPVLAIRLTSILAKVWELDKIPSDWSKSLIVPIYKKGPKSSCDNHRGISLTNIASKILASIIIGRLTKTRELQTRENQAGFRPGRGCIDHIFTIRQVLEHRHAYRRLTMVVFLDLKAAFDSVDREVLWQCLSLKGVPQKYINLVKALYSNTTSRVRAYGELSSDFAISSGVRQGCPLSPFLFNFIIDLLLEVTLSSAEFSGIDILPGGPLIDLEYADDIVLFGEDTDKIQSLLVALSNNARMFGMRFSPSKCKLLLQDWPASTPELRIGSEEVECVDNFTYLGSLISPNGLVSEEISARIRKARLAFANLRHLWRRRDIRLSTKGRVYCTAVRPVLLYGCETWPLRVEDTRRLLAFDHRCLRNISRTCWDLRVTNNEVRRRVLGNNGKSVDEVMKLHRLRWLGHVLRMSEHRLPRRSMMTSIGVGWKRVRGGQTKTWHQSLKSLTSGLSHIGRCRLPGWGPRDCRTQWLETLGDMAQNRSQWRRCIHSLSSRTP
uniref:Endonuclease-reverse transcriptase n=1 Tax=Schistosoma japonicum TaxID=6182 RepID=C7C208_SCHJA|nr:endonuclease-reverse transcriptase [Schistosoma japonicum]